MSKIPLPSVLVHKLTGHAGNVTSVYLTQNGNYCCSAGADKTIRLWNTVKGKYIYTFTGGHLSVINDVMMFSLC